MIRLTGMSSGLDTEAMITDLMSAYKGTKQKKVNTATKYSWKMDAWSSLNKKISSFQTKNLSKLRFSSSYSTKKTAVSDPTKAKVTASNSAVTGTQTLAVKQMAQAGYLTGGELSAKDASGNAVKVSGGTKLSELGFTGNGSFTIKGSQGEVKLDINESTTINDVVDKLSGAGVNASFDANSQRMFVSAKKSGVANDFSITANDSKGIEALKALGMYTSMTDAEKAANSAVAANVEKDGSGNYVLSAAGRDAVAKRAAQLRQSYGDAALKNQSDLESNSAYNDAVMTLEDENADLSVYGFEADDTREQKLTKILNYNKDKEAENQTKLQEDIDKYNSDIEGYDTSIADFDKRISEAATDEEKESLKAEKEAVEAQKKTAVEDRDRLVDGQNKSKTRQSDIDKALELQVKRDDNLAKSGETDSTADTQAQEEILNKGIAATQMAAADGAIVGGARDAVRIAGQNSEIFLNGAYFTSDSNSYDVNGLKIDVQGETGVRAGAAAGSMNAADYNTVSLTTDTDTDGIYDMVKGFIKEYNDLIKELDTMYNADSSRKYDVLTSEEKDAMEDSEVEAWEKKIKDSLLRRDENLGSVISAMKDAMGANYNINGKDYSLASFGINTMSYFLAGDNEKGVYHIDGDPDDSDSSANDDKLRDAISKDPQAVQDFFVKMSQQMYNALNKMSASSTSRSYGNFYDDKAMKTQLKTYQSAITDYESKLDKIEEKYYKQFTQMEKAMSKVNSTSTQLSGMFGM